MSNDPKVFIAPPPEPGPGLRLQVAQAPSGVPNRNGDVYPEAVRLRLLEATKQIDPAIARVLETKHARLSMGCVASQVTCSACGKTFTEQPWCEHLNASVRQTYQELVGRLSLTTLLKEFSVPRAHFASTHLITPDPFQDAVLRVTYPKAEQTTAEEAPVLNSSPCIAKQRAEFSPADVLAFKQEQRVIFAREIRCGYRLTFYLLLDGDYLVETGGGDLAQSIYRGPDVAAAVEAYLTA